MTSIDLFFVVATISLILITFFSCWALLYLALIFKKFLSTLELFENKWNEVVQGIEDLREKISNFRAYTALGAQSIKTITELFQKYLEKKGTYSQKRKKKDDLEDSE